jgi:hypothetical protein
LAAGINVGGHYKWYFSFFSLSPLPSGSLLILPEEVVVGLCNFAWAKILGFQPTMGFLGGKKGYFESYPRVQKLKI